MLKLIENMKARKVRNLVLAAFNSEQKNGRIREFYDMAILKSGLGSRSPSSPKVHQRLARYANIASDYGFFEQGIALYLDAFGAAMSCKDYSKAKEHAIDAAYLAEESGNAGRAAEIMAEAAKKLEGSSEQMLALEAYNIAARIAHGAADWAGALKYAAKHYKLSSACGYVSTEVRRDGNKVSVEEKVIDPPLSDEEIIAAKKAIASQSPQ